MSENEPVIKSFKMEDGIIEIAAETVVGELLATFAKNMMRKNSAENFVTVSMRFSGGYEPYYMTMGRCFGKSVDEKYLEKCAEASTLKSENSALRNRLHVAEDALLEIHSMNGCPPHGFCSCCCLEQAQRVAEEVLNQSKGGE